MNVWEATFDDAYKVYVERITAYQGKLIVENNGKRIAEGDVTLAYGAPFGPDVDDVSQWQDWTTAFVDGEGDVGPLKEVTEINQ